MKRTASSANASRAGAFLCAALLLLCVLVSHPVAEVGLNDDWSYVRSAKLMAETGHFMYVGWASAMLGWMLPFGAASAKVFGFSFTAVRYASVLVGAVTAYLLQRCFARAGLNAWNATLTALTFVLSPLYLPLATTYMTDLPGFLATLAGFYACLRALEAEKEGTAGFWLCAGSIAVAIGGTARQTAWLALFFMMPAAAWLLRKRRLPWVVVVITWVASLVFVRWSMVWFSHQPYSLREAVVAGYVDRDLVYAFIESVTRSTLDAAMLLLPILIAFVPLARPFAVPTRRWYYGALGLTLLALVFVWHRHTLLSWLAPFDGNYFTQNGLLDIPEIGVRRPMLGIWSRLLLGGLTWVCLVATVGYFVRLRHERKGIVPQDPASPLRKLSILLLPYTLAYGLLLLHRAVFSHIFDRYLIVLLFVPALLLVLWYQQAVAPRLPVASVILLVVSGLFTTAANHDLFAMGRARVQAANNLIAAGIPRTEFYGGFEYDGWTQVERYGFANSGYMNTPQGFTASPPIVLRMQVKPCRYWAARIAAAVQPRYALSYDPGSCAGPSQFGPVSYSSWLPPYGAKIYTQRVAERAY